MPNIKKDRKGVEHYWQRSLEAYGTQCGCVALAKYISDVLWMEEDIVIIRRGMRGEKHIDRFCFVENTIWKLRIGAVWRIFCVVDLLLNIASYPLTHFCLKHEKYRLIFIIDLLFFFFFEKEMNWGGRDGGCFLYTSQYSFEK